MLIEILFNKVTNFCSEGLWRTGEHCSLLLKHLNLVYNLLPFPTYDTVYTDMWLATAWTVRGSNPGGARFFAPVQTGPGAHPAFSIIGTVSFPGVKSGRGVTLIPQPLLMPWSWKSRAIPQLPPMGCTPCTEAQCMYKDTLYLYPDMWLAKIWSDI